MNIQQLKDNWELSLSYLQGRTIAKVVYMQDEDQDQIGWDRCAVMLILDDGTTLYPSVDDEGSGPGALWIDPSKEALKAGMPTCAPVI